MEGKKILFYPEEEFDSGISPAWKSSGIYDSVKIIVQGQIKSSGTDFRLASTSKQVLHDGTWPCFNVDQLLSEATSKLLYILEWE